MNMNNAGALRVAKHLSYSLLLLLLYLLQTVPGLFVIFGVKPILVIPAAVVIAMLEGEFVGGIYGAAAGLLCDVGSLLLFGFNGFLTCLFCIVAGLLVTFLMRCHLGNCLLFACVIMLVRGSLEFLFAFGMWGYESVWKLYVFGTLPLAVYSVAVTPVIFWAVRKIYRRFDVSDRE